MSLPVQVVVVIAAFAAATLIALAAGAADLGTALTFGQIAFAVAVVVALLRGSR